MSDWLDSSFFKDSAWDEQRKEWVYPEPPEVDVSPRREVRPRSWSESWDDPYNEYLYGGHYDRPPSASNRGGTADQPMIMEREDIPEEGRSGWEDKYDPDRPRMWPDSQNDYRGGKAFRYVPECAGCQKFFHGHFESVPEEHEIHDKSSPSFHHEFEYVRPYISSTQPIRVWRVENQSGQGPYQIDTEHSIIMGRDIDKNNPNAPHPEDDPALRPVMKKKWQNNDYVFGFESLDHLLNWFGGWEGALHDAGTGIAEYDVHPDHVIKGQHQLMFDPNHATRVQFHKLATKMPGSGLPDDPEARERYHRRQIQRARYPKKPIPYYTRTPETEQGLIRDLGPLPGGSSDPHEVIVNGKMYVLKGGYWGGPKPGKGMPRYQKNFNESADGEYLWHHVAEAFGAQHPDVILSPRPDDKRMNNVYIEGMPPFDFLDNSIDNSGTRFENFGGSGVHEIVMRPGGRNIALFHAAAGMNDHYFNNWGTLADGSPITWDHEGSRIPGDIEKAKKVKALQDEVAQGLTLDDDDSWYLRTFGNSPRHTYPPSNFTENHGITDDDTRSSSLAEQNDITPEEYQGYRSKLMDLRSKFAKRNRLDWHDELMGRWRDMWEHSKYFAPIQRSSAVFDESQWSPAKRDKYLNEWLPRYGEEYNREWYPDYEDHEYECDGEDFRGSLDDVSKHLFDLSYDNEGNYHDPEPGNKCWGIVQVGSEIWDGMKQGEHPFTKFILNPLKEKAQSPEFRDLFPELKRVPGKMKRYVPEDLGMERFNKVGSVECEWCGEPEDEELGPVRETRDGYLHDGCATSNNEWEATMKFPDTKGFRPNFPTPSDISRVEPFTREYPDRGRGEKMGPLYNPPNPGMEKFNSFPNQYENCPQCGGREHDIHGLTEYQDGSYNVECTNCGEHFVHSPNEESIVHMWGLEGDEPGEDFFSMKFTKVASNYHRVMTDDGWELHGDGSSGSWYQRDIGDKTHVIVRDGDGWIHNSGPTGQVDEYGDPEMTETPHFFDNLGDAVMRAKRGTINVGFSVKKGPVEDSSYNPERIEQAEGYRPVRPTMVPPNTKGRFQTLNSVEDDDIEHGLDVLDRDADFYGEERPVVSDEDSFIADTDGRVNYDEPDPFFRRGTTGERYSAQPGLWGDGPERTLGLSWQQPHLPEPEPEVRPSTFRRDYWNQSGLVDEYDNDHDDDQEGEDWLHQHYEDPHNLSPEDRYYALQDKYYENYDDSNWEEELDEDPTRHPQDSSRDSWCYSCGRKNPRPGHTNLNTGEECSEDIVSNTRPEESWLRNMYRANMKKQREKNREPWTRRDDLEAADNAWSDIEDHLQAQQHMKRHPEEEEVGHGYNFYHQWDPRYHIGLNRDNWIWEPWNTHDVPKGYTGPQSMDSVDHEPGTRVPLGEGGFDEFMDNIGGNRDPELGPDASRVRPPHEGRPFTSALVPTQRGFEDHGLQTFYDEDFDPTPFWYEGDGNPTVQPMIDFKNDLEPGEGFDAGETQTPNVNSCETCWLQNGDPYSTLDMHHGEFAGLYDDHTFKPFRKNPGERYSALENSWKDPESGLQFNRDTDFPPPEGSGVIQPMFTVKKIHHRRMDAPYKSIESPICEKCWLEHGIGYNKEDHVRYRREEKHSFQPFAREEGERRLSKIAVGGHGGVHAPYTIKQRGDKWVVVNDLGEVKGTHDSKEEARQHQKALYANVPGAAEMAEKKHSAMEPLECDGCGEIVNSQGLKARWRRGYHVSGPYHKECFDWAERPVQPEDELWQFQQDASRGHQFTSSEKTSDLVHSPMYDEDDYTDLGIDSVRDTDLTAPEDPTTGTHGPMFKVKTDEPDQIYGIGSIGTEPMCETCYLEDNIHFPEYFHGPGMRTSHPFKPLPYSLAGTSDRYALQQRNRL